MTELDMFWNGFIEAYNRILVYGFVHILVLCLFIIFGIVGPIIVYSNKNR